MSWYSSIPSLNMMDLWIKNNYNVLFHGRHGVGKTSMVFDAFHKQNWEIGTDYLYFSAATIDPWVDLIGVPTKVQNQHGDDVIKLIRPETINNRTIRAFFVDELNRAHKKVRNALMELIQFKSINGLRFPNLEIVWAAVNPDDDDELKFDVEKLDPAQEDRFHIHVQIPYKPNEAYFAQKYNNPEMAEAICKWWSDQPDKVKLQLTPRRLEYAIDVFTKTNDLRFVVPSEAHISSLKSAIQSGNPEKTLLKLIAANNDVELRKWLAFENNLSAVQNLVCTNRGVCSKVLHLLSDERLASFASKHKMVVEQIKSEPQKYERIIRDLAKNSINKNLKDTCEKLIPYLDDSVTQLRNIYLPKKNVQFSKRKKAQILHNYAIKTTQDIAHIDNSVAKIANILVTLSTEIGFANNSKQKMEVVAKLAEIVHPNMDEEETKVCLRILDYVYHAECVDIMKYLPLINTCVIALAKKQDKKSSIDNLLSLAPNLVMNVLLEIVGKKEKVGTIDQDQIVIEQIANEEFVDLPDEIDTVRKQSIEDLF